ncbi:ABC-type nitrate/sulfonate/bicarbonate transport systems periplasmic components-like protein [Pseudomonas putida]|uniref:ABC-type nitrate/sulfonate/bicarbonate transport systems periplasmic components-like protein n=1 Tax=Pseudomonas putida TaxID=303 RepID=A0A1L7NEX8_PSEPU|nr:ABC-type nitrate/sulfonate/bicarbonate transport systems periplasmic components-like protein [Pseudomonas putida]
MLRNVTAGGPLRLLAGNTGKLAHALIARPQIDSIEALRGGRIGILNRREGTFFQVRTMLARHGLHYPQDYSVIETGGVPARHRALLDGSIDAGLQSVPWSYQAEDEGLRNLGQIIDYIPDWQFVSVNASLPWAERNRELLQRFLAVLLESTEALYSSREAAAEVASRQLPTRRDYALRAWDYYTASNALTRDMSVSAAGLSTVLQVQRSNGLLDDPASMRVEDYQASEFLAAARHCL